MLDGGIEIIQAAHALKAAHPGDSQIGQHGCPIRIAGGCLLDCLLEGADRLLKVVRRGGPFEPGEKHPA